MILYTMLTTPVILSATVFLFGSAVGIFLNASICRRSKRGGWAAQLFVVLLNGFVWSGLIAAKGFSAAGICSCGAASALIVLSVVDFRTYEIPSGCNAVILASGILNLYFDRGAWRSYVTGFLCVSGLLLIIFFISRGNAVGGGDIKLMASAGLLLGWQQIILAFSAGCILGSVIHLSFMKIKGSDHVLAFGPYLSIGIWFSMMWGRGLIGWYIGQLTW